MSFSAYVFDAYGTLFDVHAATWVRSLAGAPYRDFRALTADALDYAGAATGGLAPALRDKLLAAYDTLAPYPDARGALEALKARGAKLAILSNGSPDMLASAVDAAGFGDLFDAVLSIDALRVYKTAPAVYALATEHFGVGAGEVSFQSSNRWDIAGATLFGFRSVWINRAGQPDEYADLPPARIVRGLDELPRLDD